MLKVKRLLTVSLAIFLCSWAGASEHYLPKAQTQFSDFPPAPKRDSDTDKADFATLHQWQAERTQEQCARARSEANATFDEFFGELKPFKQPLPPRAKAILKRIESESSDTVTAIKRRYKRPRPFLRDKTLTPCLGRIGGWAYPSGHAALSRVYANMLSDLVPKRAAEFGARSDEAALDRVIGGVHHPSDIEAGKRLGDTLYKELTRSPAFQRDMSTLRLSLNR